MIHAGCSSFKTRPPSDTNRNSCPVIPLTSEHPLTTDRPSSNHAQSFLSLGSNKGSIIVGSIGVVVLLSIVVTVIFVSIFKCRDQKISAGSVYSRGMSYRQLLQDSAEFHHQTSTSEQEWTAHNYTPETSGPHPGVIMDCPPPPYHTIVTLTQPVDECNASSGNGMVHDSRCFTDPEAPPPYPGS